MEEHHDIANGPLLGPGALDPPPALGADALDLLEPRRVILDDVENLLPEFANQFPRVNGSDALDQPAPQVFLDAFARGGGVLLRISARNCRPNCRS